MVDFTRVYIAAIARDCLRCVGRDRNQTTCGCRGGNLSLKKFSDLPKYLKVVDEFFFADDD